LTVQESKLRMFSSLKSVAGPLFGLLVAFLATGMSSAGPASQADERNELIKGSRKAIIGTGFSESYFDRHFKLNEVFNKPGDQRVVWQFSLGEYETRVTDSIGYNAIGSRKNYVHSIAGNLGATRDIPKTISKKRARSLLTSCVGKFANESVVLMKLDSDRKAALYMMAYSSPRVRKKEDERGQNEQRQTNIGPDRPPSEDEGRNRPLKIGYINLETGKCTRGQANVAP
jgi:hypothetical protein